MIKYNIKRLYIVFYMFNNNSWFSSKPSARPKPKARPITLLSNTWRDALTPESLSQKTKAYVPPIPKEKSPNTNASAPPMPESWSPNTNASALMIVDLHPNNNVEPILAVAVEVYNNTGIVYSSVIAICDTDVSQVQESRIEKENIYSIPRYYPNDLVCERFEEYVNKFKISKNNLKKIKKERDQIQFLMDTSNPDVDTYITIKYKQEIRNKTLQIKRYDEKMEELIKEKQIIEDEYLEYVESVNIFISVNNLENFFIIDNLLSTENFVSWLVKEHDKKEITKEQFVYITDYIDIPRIQNSYRNKNRYSNTNFITWTGY